MKEFHGRFTVDDAGFGEFGTLGLQIDNKLFYLPLGMTKDALERAIGAIVVSEIRESLRRPQGERT